MHFLLKGVIFTFGLVLASCTPIPQCPAARVEDAKKAEVALADFAVKLFKTVSAKDENKNQVMSPVSIALALALLENGADGKTRQELKNVLVESQSVDVLTTYRAVEVLLRLTSGTKIYHEEQKVKLTIANGLFKANDLKLKDSYLQSTRECMETKIDDADFRNQLEQTRQKINKFVSDQTNSKIPELFKQGVLTDDDKMVLANAIYFNASWKNSFNKAMTKPDTFYRNGRDQDKQTVQFMHEMSQHRHGSTDDVDALELTYAHPDMAMFVILPKQRDGLRNLEQRLTGKQLRDIMSKMEQKSVKVQMPKFTIRSPIDLKEALTQLGLESMFSNKDANFGRMSDDELKVGAAIHEAYITINENGTEAAAATGMSINPRTMPLPPVQDATPFVADHPFLYAIVHKTTGAIVFLGKVNSIEQKEN